MPLTIPQKNLFKSGPVTSPVKLSKLQFTITEVIFLLILIGLFYWFVVQPKTASVKAQNEQLSQANLEKEQIQKNLADLNKSITVLESNQTDIKYLDEALPLDSRSTKPQILVESLAASAGVTVNTVNFQPEGDVIYATDKEAAANPYAAKRSLKKLMGNIYVTGNFQQLETFLQKIEDSGRIMNIQSLDMASEQAGLLSLKLNLEAYSYE